MSRNELPTSPDPPRYGGRGGQTSLQTGGVDWTRRGFRDTSGDHRFATFGKLGIECTFSRLHEALCNPDRIAEPVNPALSAIQPIGPASQPAERNEG